MFLLLGNVDTGDPAFWGVIIGWIMSVTLHEFAHNLVGYWGGDTSIREEGRLNLNPLQYVDPFMTIIIPMIMLMLGGIPLPGASTYVDRSRLHSKFWDSAVSAAGPLMNLLLFGILAIPLLPQVGWVSWSTPLPDWTVAQRFVGAMCFLQLLSVLLNLVPIPGLDGFGIIAPHLNEDLRLRLTTPPYSSMFLFGYFMLLWMAPGFLNAMVGIMRHIMGNELFIRSIVGYHSIFR